MGKIVAVERDRMEVGVRVTDTSRVHLYIRDFLGGYSIAALTFEEARKLGVLLIERAAVAEEDAT